MRYPDGRAQMFPVCVCAALLWSASLLTGCGSFTVTDKGFFTAISATSNSVRVNQTLQLSDHVQITGVPIQFFVNGIAGGNSEVGTIDANGLYTAPAIVPVPNTVTVTSIAPKYPDYPQGSFAVSVLNPIPILNTVTPSSFAEGMATVTVDGSQFVYGAQIVWNGGPVSTTFVSSTELIAVIAASTPGTFPLLVSNPNPGSANSSAANIQVAHGQVVLQIDAGQGTDVRVGNSISFGLTVTGTLNTAVTLQVNGVPGGNAQVGTAVFNADGSISYAAPLVVPTPSNVVALKVTSVDNPAVSLTRNISVLNPIPLLNSASPASFNVGANTVVVQGSHLISGAQVVMNGAAVATTFNSGAQLTATITPTQPGPIDLQVLNPNPGPALSNDLIGNVQGTQPVLLVSPEDASRFLDQATFGATDGDIHHLSLVGYQAWLNEQFSMPQTPEAPLIEQALILNNPPCAPSDLKCNGALFAQNDSGEVFVENLFWQQSLAANDQLRQRVRYALEQMFVISGVQPSVGNMPRGEANYNDVIGADAFGNFRKLLEDVTLNPMMGQYLNMLGNDKGNATTDPDENYAREVMQLFTIGLYELNDDGSVKVDTNGQPTPTFSNTDVMGLAKVFTGLSFNVPGNTSGFGWYDCCLYIGPGYGEDLLPMTSYPNHHSAEEKDFLGVTIPASTTSDTTGDLKIALDTLFNHPNVPAFVGRQLIQHLVTSNPSPAYVSRIAAVFKDNGSGVRGDLKAVITAILLDPEARDTASDFNNPQYGKVREALIRYTEWARAFTAQSRNGGYYIGSTEDPIYGLGEMPLRSPSVFNWFSPRFVPPGTSIEQAGLVAPEMQMTNVSTVVGYLNYMQDAIGADASNGPDLFASYGAEMNLAATPDQLLDRINLLLMAGQMDSTARSQILAAVSAISIPTGDQNAINAALAARVKTAIYLTMALPSYGAQF